MPKRIDLAQTPSPGKDIEIDLLQHYVNRYKTERYKHIINHINDDSRGAWISRNKLQEFLDNNPNASGIRMYFGVIEDDNAGFQQGAHNLIFVPTEKSVSDNIDMLSNDDWVIVIENPSSSAIIANYEGAICPPPKNPCGGNGLNY